MGYITDIIANDYWAWQAGTYVFFDSDTGTGKSTAIRKKIWPFARSRQQEILYLINRVSTHRQIVKEFCDELGIDSSYFDTESFVELPGITVATYQSVAERVLQDGRIVNLPFYYFVVADEVHYLVADSTFSPQTMRILDWIKNLEAAVFIAMSATPKEVLRYLPHGDSQWRPVYEQENKKIFIRDARDIVRNLKMIPEFLWVYTCKNRKPTYNIFVYDDIEDLVSVINKDHSTEKWLIFQGNKQKAVDRLQKKLNCTTQLITADNREGEAMQQVIKEYRFNSKVLVTTQVLDNGVSLKDENLVNIAIETLSEIEFKQMLGRKRVLTDEEMHINLYLPRLSAKYFKNVLNLQLNPTLEFLNIPKEKVLERMMKSEDDYHLAKRFYDVRGGLLVRNEIAVDKLKRDKAFCKKKAGIMEHDPDNWVKQQLCWLGLDETYEVVYLSDGPRMKAKADLLTLLSNKSGCEILGNEQVMLRSEITRIGKVLCQDMTTHEDRVWGLKKINDFLAKIEIGFAIVSINGKKKGEKTRWLIKNV